MKQASSLTLTTSPPAQPGGKPPGLLALRCRGRLPCRGLRHMPAGKGLDPETGLYYYGARYLDPKTARWLSGDPAIAEYVPSAPVNDEAKKKNQNLPGMGGVFNHVNLHAYHYAGNNPVKYIDPDGNYLINNVARNTGSARNFASATSPTGVPINNIPIGVAQVFRSGTNQRVNVSPKTHEAQFAPFTGIEFELGLTGALDTALSNRNFSSITARAEEMRNGNFEIKVTVRTGGRTVTATVAFANRGEVLNGQGRIDRDKVINIANDTINIARNTVGTTNNIDRNN